MRRKSTFNSFILLVGIAILVAVVASKQSRQSTPGQGNDVKPLRPPQSIIRPVRPPSPISSASFVDYVI